MSAGGMIESVIIYAALIALGIWFIAEMAGAARDARLGRLMAETRDEEADHAAPLAERRADDLPSCREENHV